MNGVEVPDNPYAEGTPLDELYGSKQARIVSSLMSETLPVEGAPADGVVGNAKTQVNDFLGLDFPYGQVLGDEDLIVLTGDYDAPEVASQMAENSDIITETEDGYALNRTNWLCSEQDKCNSKSC